MSAVTKRIVGTVLTREVLVSDDADVVGCSGERFMSVINT